MHALNRPCPLLGWSTASNLTSLGSTTSTSWWQRHLSCRFVSSLFTSSFITFTLSPKVYTLTTTPGQPQHLALVFEKSFFGNIESLCAVRLPGTKTDNLVMSFRDAKVSVVAWDPEAYDLKIISCSTHPTPSPLALFFHPTYIPICLCLFVLKLSSS